ncbi:MAG: restriction endonuclease subunit S [Deltaproteobacteria bacterium]|nr:restriction endonuclease subunit S [Deltaproteobacteria bacterium]
MKGLLPSNGVLPEFLAYALKFREPEVLQKIETAGHGTRRLRTAVLESLQVPVPLLSEQGRIVEYLNQTAETITTLRRFKEGRPFDGNYFAAMESSACHTAESGKNNFRGLFISRIGFSWEKDVPDIRDGTTAAI